MASADGGQVEPRRSQLAEADGPQEPSGGSESGPCLDSETSDEMPEMLSLSCASTPGPGHDSDMEFQVPSEEVLRSMRLQTAEQLCLRKAEVSREAFRECLLFFFAWLRTKHPCMGARS